MYNCRYCGGNLRFDIPSQRLKCPYCDSDFDCYELEKTIDTEDSDSYDVTVFSCPACGAEIVSSDSGAAEFCSYCGSSVVLDARLRKEKRPQKIIPFKKSSEDCIAAYKKRLKQAVFAPSVLKDPSFLENFRGIYIPYWSYSFSHQGPVSLSAKHEYRSGDYDVTDYYKVTGDVDSHYEGICYDASSSFDDAISAAIAPFDPRQMQDFTPSFLSGFYADVADVPADTYIEDANQMANDDILDYIQSDPAAGIYPITRSAGIKTMNNKLNTQVGEPLAAMLPVWFLTWRDRDRVAYMTVNGQTGKVYADIPIDIRKYIAALLICSVPLYFILDFLFSFTAPTSLFISGIFSLISGIIYYEEVSAIMKRDSHELDRGFQRRQSQKLNEQKSKAGSRKKDKKSSSGSKPLSHRLIHIGTIASLALLVLSFFINYSSTDDLLGSLFSRVTLNFLLIGAVFIFWELILLDGDEKNAVHRPARGIMGSQLAAILGAVINIIHPVSDIVYYIAMIIVYLGIFSTLINVLKKYNLLITHPAPGLHDRGKEQA